MTEDAWLESLDEIYWKADALGSHHTGAGIESLLESAVTAYEVAKKLRSQATQLADKYADQCVATEITFYHKNRDGELRLSLAQKRSHTYEAERVQWDKRLGASRQLLDDLVDIAEGLPTERVGFFLDHCAGLNTDK